MMFILLHFWAQPEFCTKSSDQFEGTVRFLFQPGEEKNPGGASYMIRDGALGKPNAILHHGSTCVPAIAGR